MRHKILTLTSILVIVTFALQQLVWAGHCYTPGVQDGLRPRAFGEGRAGEREGQGEEAKMGELFLGGKVIPLYFNIDSFWEISRTIMDAPMQDRGALKAELAVARARVLGECVDGFLEDIGKVERYAKRPIIDQDDRMQAKEAKDSLRDASSKVGYVSNEEILDLVGLVGNMAGDVREYAQGSLSLEEPELQAIFRAMMYRLYFINTFADHMQRIVGFDNYSGVLESSCDIVGYLRDAFVPWEQEARRLGRKGQFAFNSEGEIPDIRCNLATIEDGLIELVKNALNFSATNLTLNVRREKNDLFVELIDNGKGMDQDEIRKAGLIFYSTAPETPRERSGNGLGVFMAEAASQFHHGLFEIDSRRDVGTTMRLILPLGRLMAAAPSGTELGARRALHSSILRPRAFGEGRTGAKRSHIFLRILRNCWAVIIGTPENDFIDNKSLSEVTMKFAFTSIAVSKRILSLGSLHKDTLVVGKTNIVSTFINSLNLPISLAWKYLLRRGFFMTFKISSWSNGESTGVKRPVTKPLYILRNVKLLPIAALTIILVSTITFSSLLIKLLTNLFAYPIDFSLGNGAFGYAGSDPLDNLIPPLLACLSFQLFNQFDSIRGRKFFKGIFDYPYSQIQFSLSHLASLLDKREYIFYHRISQGKITLPIIHCSLSILRPRAFGEGRAGVATIPPMQWNGVLRPVAAGERDVEEGRRPLVGNLPSRREAEPHLSQGDEYTRALNNLLNGPNVTEESKKRRLALKKIGQKIEKFIRKLLEDKKIKIIIIPRGSTLLGYACETSDIEYDIHIIFRDFEQGEHDIQDEDKKLIFDRCNKLIEKEGYSAEDMIKRVSYIWDISPITAGDMMSISQEPTEVISILFFPIGYGDGELLEKARRNVIKFLSEQKRKEDIWSYIQDEYKENLSIDNDVIPRKSHLKKWLEDQGVNVILTTSINKFNKERYLQIRLPDLDIMQNIYIESTSSFNKDKPHYGAILEGTTLQIQKGIEKQLQRAI